MSATPEALARMYPSLATNSAVPAASGPQADSAPSGSADPSLTGKPDGGAASEQLSDAEKELERAQRMYPPENMLEHIQPVWPVEIPPEQQTELTATVHRELGRKLMLGPQESQTVVDTVAAFGATDATPEQQAAWKAESENFLREESMRTGRSTAQLLADAKAHLARSPQTAKLLTDRGLLNNPQIVKIIVERGRSSRMKGLLK